MKWGKYFRFRPSAEYIQAYSSWNMNSRNLPYYDCIFLLPLLMQKSIMDALLGQ